MNHTHNEREDVERLVSDVMREYLTPPPMVAPGAELRHLVVQVHLLREAVRQLAADVAALRRG